MRRATGARAKGFQKTGISIHALLAESDRSNQSIISQPNNFYPRSPCGERLHYDNYNLHCVEISIHALLAESDVEFQLDFINQKEFLSTLSLRRATARRASRQQPAGISIHALLAESDPLIFSVQPRKTISIHALLAESDGGGLLSCFVKIIFLSTLSLRRATPAGAVFLYFIPNFYPRSPCGERPAYR